MIHFCEIYGFASKVQIGKLKKKNQLGYDKATKPMNVSDF